MVLKLYAHLLSPFVQKVLVTLLETETPYELVLVDYTKGENKDPDFMATKNPFGAIPVIVRTRLSHDGCCPLTTWPQEDDGFLLYESTAICRYIAAKAGSPLLPTGDLRRVARFEQALSIQAAQLEAAFVPIVAERIKKPYMTGAPPDEVAVAALAGAFEARLAGAEVLLGTQRYLAGDTVTLADLLHLPYSMYAAPQGFTWYADPVKYPNVARCVKLRVDRGGMR
jgi:glutathione S-transferase